MHAGLLPRLFLVASLAAILAATLSSSPGDEPERLLTCIVCGDRGLADVLVNVLLFLPLGAAIAAAGVPLPRCVLGGALLSAGIEFAQLYIPGRDPSLGDVLADTLGSGVGAVLVLTVPYGLRPARARATRLSRGAALAAATLCCVTGLLLAPALPQSQYWSLWTPNLADLEWYRGRLREAAMGDLRLPAGRIPHAAAVRDLLLSPQGFALHVHAIAGPRTAAVSALLTIHDDQGREIVLLGPDRDDLVFRFRTRATAWRLDQPDIRVPGALRSVNPGDALDVTVRGRGGRYAIAVDRSSGASGLGFTVGSGWALLMYPESLPAALKAFLSFAWCAALWVPAGFWARTRRDAWITGGVLAVSLLGVPAVTSLRATPLLQWAAAGLGGVAGAICRRLVDSASERRPE